MSCENAIKFLLDVTHKEELRTLFNDVTNPDDFITRCQKLGYDFTHEELETVIREHSVGVEIRRKTGVWVWLRKVHWI